MTRAAETRQQVDHPAALVSFSSSHHSLKLSARARFPIADSLAMYLRMSTASQGKTAWDDGLERFESAQAVLVK